MKEKRTIPQGTLDQIIQRIVEVAKPEKIVLFGSAARSEMGPHSDVDLLVIKAGAHRLDLTGQIYRNLHGVEEAVDIVVVTPEDVERYHNSHALVIAPALKEGKVVYAVPLIRTATVKRGHSAATCSCAQLSGGNTELRR